MSKARKRIVATKNGSDGTDKAENHDKGYKATRSEVKSNSATWMAAMLLGTMVLLGVVSGAVYVHNFIGFSKFLNDLNPRSVESPLQQSSSSAPPSGSVPHQKPPSSSSSSSSSTPSSSSSSHQTEASTERSQDTKSPKAKSKTPYVHAAITNNVDNKIRRELDEADELRGQKRSAEAMKRYNSILTRYPKSPRANHGKAETLNLMAEEQRSNPILEQAIDQFSKVHDLPEVPEALDLKNVRRLAERLTFRGWGKRAAEVLRKISDRYAQNVQLRNELGVSYLMAGKVPAAKEIFQEVLLVNPDNGFAKCHLGFIVKTADNDMEKAIPLLREGIDSREKGTDDGRFFFHLGDALNRVNSTDEAYEVYQQGADRGHFLSMYQRSLYNVNTLAGRPWWTQEQTSYKKYFQILEKNWETIRDEGLAQMDMKTGSFLPEEENLREKGDWKQFTLWQRGKKVEGNCRKAPKTCSLLSQVPDATGCTRGQIKFSVMQPGVHVWPHCGPTNCRIRAHLGLVVPKGPRLRIANETYHWSEGKFIVFDDSFEHEVWHDGDSFRLVLIVDFWHPELTAHQRKTLAPI